MLRSVPSAKESHLGTTEQKQIKGKEAVTWLHLSDWHQGKPDFDRRVLLRKLLDDIKARAQLDSRFSGLDAVIFSGDIAYSGKAGEYAAVEKDLIAPLRDMLGKETKFIFAPGNHDIDRELIAEIPLEWERLITSRSAGRAKQIGDLLYDPRKAPLLLSPFDAFYAFSNRNQCVYPNAALVTSAFLGDGQVGVVAINTATCCARNSLSFGKNDADPLYPWDYGTLSISEQQLIDAIDQIENARIKILVMHHPISWMHESEQPMLEQNVASKFDLVLYGHEHLPRFSSVSGNFGDIKFIPAGCSFAGRVPENPRYTNAFNFGVLDLKANEGAIHHRIWREERSCWSHDDRYWQDGIARFLIQKDVLQSNKKYIFDAHRGFVKYQMKRPAKLAEITLTHSPREIEGRRFIEAVVRYRLQLHPGPAENYKFRTVTNPKIIRDPSKAVQELAFSVVSMLPRPTETMKDENSHHRILGAVDLSDKSTTIEYHYRMLETEFGVWFFKLGRFADRVKFQIKKADGYEYDFLPLGGFPDLRPGADGLLSFESLESEGGHLPEQGYMVQWYRCEKDRAEST